MAAEFDAYYDGSRIFSWVSDISGLPLDQVRSICKKCDFVYFNGVINVSDVINVYNSRVSSIATCSGSQSTSLCFAVENNGSGLPVCQKSRYTFM